MRKRFLACSLAIATVTAFCGAASAQSSSAAGSSASGQMHQKMMDGMQKMQSMQPTGDTDKDFAMMMRMHHQQALEMAQVELNAGKSPEMKAMARKIMAGQKKEIEEFDKWMASHK